MTTATFDDDFQISVLLAAPALETADFTTPLIASDTMGVGFTETTRLYRSASEANADSDLSANLKAMLSAIFAQRNAPRQVRVGKVALTADVWTIEGLAPGAVGNTITIDFLGGSQVVFTSATGSESAADIVDALKGDLDLLGVAISTTDNGDDLTIAGTVAGQLLGLTVAVTGTATATATHTTTAATWTSELDKLRDAASWYYLLLEAQTNTINLAAAAWAEINKRLFVAQTTDANVLDADKTSDLAAQLQTLNYNQTAVIYSSSGTAWRAAAYVGARAGFDPEQRSAPWNKILATGQEPESITSTQKTAAEGKSANLALRSRGVVVFGPGKVAAGYDIELIVSANWLQARMEEELAQTLLNRTSAGLKTEYTPDGVEVLLNVMRSVLSQAQRARHIKRGYKVLSVDVDGLSNAVVDSGVLSPEWRAEPVKSITKVNGTGLLFRGSVSL